MVSAVGRGELEAGASGGSQGIVNEPLLRTEREL